MSELLSVARMPPDAKAAILAPDTSSPMERAPKPRTEAMPQANTTQPHKPAAPARYAEGAPGLAWLAPLPAPLNEPLQVLQRNVLVCGSLEGRHLGMLNGLRERALAKAVIKSP